MLEPVKPLLPQPLTGLPGLVTTVLVKAPGAIIDPLPEFQVRVVTACLLGRNQGVADAVAMADEEQVARHHGEMYTP
jgi:hypothetical protein